MAIIPSIDIETMWVDDVPVSPSRADFYDEMGAVVPVSQYESWHAEMFSPSNVSVGELTGTEHGNHLEFTWPSVSILTEPGVYTIVITFIDTGVQRTCEPWQFAVQSRDGWHTLESARAKWPDAPINDVILYNLLQTARAQCEAYAPVLGLLDQVPPRYREAQIMQARALFMASISNQQDSVGVDGFQVRTFPLDWNIKALLRPKRAIGGMF